MIGAIILGLIAGAIARFLIPNDALERMGGLVSWVLTLVLGLVGAWLGWWIFTGLLGIGDEDKFDLGGIIGAIVGAVIVLLVATWILRRTGRSA
ncbi:MAG TPA: GlsB/YeaQ/YmgE family stress response membrane protein [Thermoleophilia bacterium]|nr:GlsB/YeaQ/YmgE family stress response membrane protein [Thermoleophilia bacterium]